MNYNPPVIGDLVGKTFIKIEHDSDTFNFIAANHSSYGLYHSQDCCESVVLEDVSGDVEDLVGTPILEAYESSNTDLGQCGDSATWTFYRFVTNKGSVVLRWCGQSNGYYSERVDFRIL